MRRFGSLLAAAILLCARLPSVSNAADPRYPDWPCIQAKVPDIFGIPGRTDVPLAGKNGEAVKKAIAFDKIGKKADKPYRIAYLTECVTNTYCEARMKGLQEAADKYGFTFASAGTFEYFCGLHPHMKGKVVVTP